MNEITWYVLLCLFLFHLTQHLRISNMSSHVTVTHAFSLLLSHFSNIPVCLYSHLLMKILQFPNQNKLLRILLQSSIFISLGPNTQEWNYWVTQEQVYNYFYKKLHFSRQLYHFTFLPSIYEHSSCCSCSLTWYGQSF